MGEYKKDKIMMKPLRKRHLQVWTLLAVLIPAGIISGYFVIPKEATNKLIQEDSTAALPVTVNKIDRKGYLVYLRSSADKMNLQLQWINTKASIIPSSLIYKTGNAEKELIGRVEGQGSFYFPLKADSTNTYHFILYDIIHQQTIDTINF
jgi:hypothetical protein